MSSHRCHLGSDGEGGGITTTSYHPIKSDSNNSSSSSSSSNGNRNGSNGSNGYTNSSTGSNGVSNPSTPSPTNVMMENNNNVNVTCRVSTPMSLGEEKHVRYEVHVSCLNKSWILHKRYSEFGKLHDLIKKHSSLGVTGLKLPPKRFFGSNFDHDLIRTRTAGLNDFMSRIISEPRLLSLREVQSFLQLEKFCGSCCISGHQSDHSSSDDDSDRTINTIDMSQLTVSSMDTSPAANFKLGSSEKVTAIATDFDFLKVIGKGSFGKVLLARHKTEDKIYAVKVLSKKMILKRNEKAHIMCERSVLVKNHHPFLVSLQYSFQSRDKLYFVMDYVNGGELFFHLQKDRYFTESRAKFYAAEITSALGYLHSIGIIYRDLKPENILLNAEGHVVLTDFGLCKDGVREGDKTNTFCGTPEYLAPEVLRKESYDRAVDWWCLGAVTYEMLYGLPPFYSRDTAEMYENILHKPVRTKGNISLAARDFLEKLLEKDKKKRLGSKRDADEIREHDFFRSVNWADLEKKNILPPFNPNVKGDLDLKNIDVEFTREPVPQSVGKSGGLSLGGLGSSIPANAFEGFSYAAHNSNSHLMS